MAGKKKSTKFKINPYFILSTHDGAFADGGNMAGLAASLPFATLGNAAGNMVDDLTGGEDNRTNVVGNAAAEGALKGAGQLASMGSAFGPIGSLVGAGVGAIGGGLMAGINAKNELEDTFKDTTTGLRANGGKINNELGGDISMVNGPRHEQGGVPINPNVEVEGGEAIVGNEVLSDRLVHPETGRTFAQEAQRIKAKYKDRVNDGPAMKAQAAEIAKLVAMNDAARVAQEQLDKEMQADVMAYGGCIKKGNGGKLEIDPVMLPLIKQSAKFRNMDLDSYTSKLMELGGPLTEQANKYLDRSFNEDFPSMYVGLTPLEGTEELGLSGDLNARAYNQALVDRGIPNEEILKYQNEELQKLMEFRDAQTFATGGPITPPKKSASPYISTYSPTLPKDYGTDYKNRYSQYSINPIDPKTGAPTWGSGGEDAGSSGTGGNYIPLTAAERASRIKELETWDEGALTPQYLEEYLTLKNNKPYFRATGDPNKTVFEPYDLRTYKPAVTPTTPTTTGGLPDLPEFKDEIQNVTPEKFAFKSVTEVWPSGEGKPGVETNLLNPQEVAKRFGAGENHPAFEPYWEESSQAGGEKLTGNEGTLYRTPSVIRYDAPRQKALGGPLADTLLDNSPVGSLPIRKPEMFQTTPSSMDIIPNQFNEIGGLPTKAATTMEGTTPEVIENAYPNNTDIFSGIDFSLLEGLDETSTTETSQDSAKKFGAEELGLIASSLPGLDNFTRSLKPEVTEYETMDPSFMDLSAARDAIGREATQASNIQRANVRGNARSSGEALSALSTGEAAISKNEMDAVMQSYLAENEVNTGIRNNAEQMNTQIKNTQNDVNAQNRAMADSLQNMSLADLSGNIQGYIKDKKLTATNVKNNEQIMSVINAITPNYKWESDNGKWALEFVKVMNQLPKE